MGHGDEKQGASAEDEEREGGAGAGKGPGVVVLNPDGLITGDHTFDRLAHYLHGDDDAKAWVPKQKEGIENSLINQFYNSTFTKQDVLCYL